MIASFIITFRETLEAALIVGIVLSYLSRTNNSNHNRVVYSGTALAIGASLLGAFIFNSLAGGFSGRAEEIFEGITMLIGALLLTTMIIWMMKQKNIAGELENRVSTKLTEAHMIGLFFLVFFAILREGIETVIFLQAASFAAEGASLSGAVLGIIAAMLLGYAIFLGSMKVNLKKFFNVTSILLILFAAGLVAHGVHELQEAHLVPIIIEHIWDINPAVASDGVYPLLHEKGYIGSIFKGLFGYNGNPSLIEVKSYIIYMISISIIWRTINKRKYSTA
ncbi:MAG: FTR1 family protein [Nitrospirota bacterium]|nr:MAG: FTR1 family protein [Nitrospirota bacterium]